MGMTTRHSCRKMESLFARATGGIPVQTSSSLIRTPWQAAFFSADF